MISVLPISIVAIRAEKDWGLVRAGRRFSVSGFGINFVLVILYSTICMFRSSQDR